MKAEALRVIHVLIYSLAIGLVPLLGDWWRRRRARKNAQLSDVLRRPSE